LDQNAVRKIREKLLVSKAELARKAGVSPITIDRVENGMACRMETKRKIIFALGLNLSDKEKVFPRGLISLYIVLLIILILIKPQKGARFTKRGVFAKV